MTTGQRLLALAILTACWWIGLHLAAAP